jgi:hypothetical protein
MTTITFTGHRDRLAREEDLASIHDEFPEAVWIHGGAFGFDTQIADYCRNWGILQLEVVPNYEHPGHLEAPLRRNRQMVDAGDLVVACWDGRTTGGTYYTVQYANRKGKPVRSLASVPKEGE